MSQIREEGGDPACWAHLLDDGEIDLAGVEAVVTDLGNTSTDAGGVVWSLPHGGDLDANLVRLRPGSEISEHVNDEVDVLVFVQSGGGELTIDGETHPLRGDVLALVPRGATRQVSAGVFGITYLSIHRRRGPLRIG